MSSVDILELRERAACRGTTEPEIFFPSPASDPHTIERAKAFCASCVVSTQCLEWALHVEGESSYTYRSGIYGGIGPRGRWEIQRCRRGACKHRDHQGEAS